MVLLSSAEVCDERSVCFALWRISSHRVGRPFRRLSELWFCAIAMGLAAAGCTDLYGNYRYTGQTGVYPVLDQRDRIMRKLSKYSINDISDFGSPGAAFVEDGELDPQKVRYFKDLALEPAGTRTLTIKINRCFAKYLADIDPSKEILAFVEVTDHADGSVHKRVFFGGEFIAEGSYLNFSNATVYGPVAYKGRPITIEFYIVELDQKENQVRLAAIKEIRETVALLGPEAAIAGNVIAGIAEMLVKANVDDRELGFRCELTPITTEHPADVDRKIAGNVLRTGNYVVVKQEFRRSDADAASILPFEDEISYPRWIRSDAFKDYAWLPNVVYLGGQLYVTRAFSDVLSKIAGTSAGESRIRSELPPPSAFATTEENIARARDRIRKLTETVKNEIRTQPEALPNQKDYIPAANFVESPITADESRRDKKGDVPPASEQQHFGEDGKEKLRFQDFILANYTPYSSKSYLSFTVRDDLSPADPKTIAEFETQDLDRISKIVLTLSAEEQTAIIGAFGATIRSAVVRIIAHNRLRSEKTEKGIKDAQEELKKRFGAVFETDIMMEANYRSAMLQRLKAKGIDPSGLDLKSKLVPLLPILRQQSPELARFAEQLLNDSPEPVKSPTSGSDGD